MKRLNEFVLTVALGGFLVILPLLVLYKVFIWLITVFSDAVLPITELLMRFLGIGQSTAELIVLALLFSFCFVLGAFIQTGLGIWLHGSFEKHLLTRIPGYSTIKDIIKQFSGGHQGLFRKVVRVSLTGNQKGPFVTGLLTDEYQENQVTVFIPTGPNPTTGLILHTTVDNIAVLNTSVEKAMKTIISCGAGSGELLHSLNSVN